MILSTLQKSKIDIRYSSFNIFFKRYQGIFAIRPFILPPNSNSNCPFPFSLHLPLSAFNQNPMILSTLQKSKIKNRYSSFNIFFKRCQGIFAIRPFILPSSLLKLKLLFPFQPSPSTLCLQPESNDSINTSKIKNPYSIFFLQHLFQTLPGHICNPPLHTSSQLQLKLPFPFQPSPSTLCLQPESNDSINTSKIKNQKSIFFLQHLFQTLPGHICNPPLHTSFLPTQTQTALSLFP